MTRDRRCSKCGREKVVSGREARLVFHDAPWTDADVLTDRALVCSFCTHVRLPDGAQTRLVTPSERAYQLAQATSNSDKGRGYWERELTGGDGRLAT